MCGRAAATYSDQELAMRYLNKRPINWPDFKPNYNLAPTQHTPVILVKDGMNQAERFRFGLVPAWAKDVKSASQYSLINAKGEEIHEKRSYKSAFERRRCIVPLSSFIEWKREGDKKRPHAIHLKDEPIMSVAAVYERWQSKTGGELVDSFALITTGPNSFMEPIHDRMPVILSRDDEAAWLDPENKNIDALKALLKPCPPEWLSAYEISALINSPKNNIAECLLPVADAPGQMKLI